MNDDLNKPTGFGPAVPVRRSAKTEALFDEARSLGVETKGRFAGEVRRDVEFMRERATEAQAFAGEVLARKQAANGGGGDQPPRAPNYQSSTIMTPAATLEDSPPPRQAAGGDSLPTFEATVCIDVDGVKTDKTAVFYGYLKD